ncbi:hypothetical protein RRG08_046329 [Elysia crispata]|uniref:Uncharacterized protein n=1 Tax=Elysia crispata TaxID=231223 RepID=A0AAE1A4H1_9GAST|nr:hypothetical protein RRG08_046329 [Elysia crispata]
MRCRFIPKDNQCVPMLFEETSANDAKNGDGNEHWKRNAVMSLPTHSAMLGTNPAEVKCNKIAISEIRCK